MMKIMFRTKQGLEMFRNVEQETILEIGVIRFAGDYYVYRGNSGKFHSVPVFDQVDFLDMDGA